MTERLRALYHKLRRKYPVVEYLVLRLRKRNMPSKVTMHVKGANNIVRHHRALLSNVVFDIEGNSNTIEIGENCLLNSVTFFVRGDNHAIVFGSGCRFHHGADIWFEDNGGRLEIGERSTFEDVHLAVTEPGSKILIGKDCMFARDIDVRTGDSHSLIDLSTGERINYAEDVQIGNHVWVASHCTILKGSSLPDNSVVATGSIVTKRFTESATLLAGNPARVIKQGIGWSRDRIYKRP